MLAAHPSLPSIVEHDDKDDDLFLQRGFRTYSQQQPFHQTLSVSPPRRPSSSGPYSMRDSQQVQYWTPVPMPPSPTSSPQFGVSPESSPPTPTHEVAPIYAPPSPSDTSSASSVDQHQSPSQHRVLPPRTSPPTQHHVQFQLQPSVIPVPPPLPAASNRPPLPRKPTPLRVSTTPHQLASSSSLRSPTWRSWLSSGFVWIGLYFVFNMGLTLYNKKILVHFPFPYSLTALHTFCGTVGCLWLKRIGYFTPARLTPRQNLVLALFSVLYTMNIAVSNISLQLVTVPFHQVVRATAPAFTILVAWLLGASRGKGLLGVGGTKLLSLVPVVAGVGFATYGDYSFTAWGFILTLFGTFLAALKTVLTSILQTPSQASRSATPLPTSTPTSPAPPPHNHVRKDSATSIEFLPSPAVNENGAPTYHKSLLTAKLQANSHSHHHHHGRFHSVSSSIARRLSPIRSYIFSILPRSSFVTRRFDLDFGLQSQNVMATSIKLHPLDLLMRMSPLAFVQCVYYSWATGEMERAMRHRGPGAAGWSRASAAGLLMNGVIAFLLNIVSLTANQKNGPLTMTVAANVKQVLTILLAMYMFHLTVNPANAVGIALTLAGGAWYGALEYQEKKARMRLGR